MHLVGFIIRIRKKNKNKPSEYKLWFGKLLKWHAAHYLNMYKIFNHRSRNISQAEQWYHVSLTLLQTVMGYEMDIITKRYFASV